MAGPDTCVSTAWINAQASLNANNGQEWRNNLQGFTKLYVKQFGDKAANSTWEMGQEVDIALTLCKALFEFFYIGDDLDVAAAQNELQIQTAHMWLKSSDATMNSLNSLILNVLYINDEHIPLSYENSNNSSSSGNGNGNSSKKCFRHYTSIEDNRHEFLLLIHTLSYLLRCRRPRVAICEAYSIIIGAGTDTDTGTGAGSESDGDGFIVHFLLKVMNVMMSTFIESSILDWSDFLSTKNQEEDQDQDQDQDQEHETSLPSTAAASVKEDKDNNIDETTFRSIAQAKKSKNSEVEIQANAKAEANAEAESRTIITKKREKLTLFGLSAWVGLLHMCTWNHAIYNNGTLKGVGVNSVSVSGSGGTAVTGNNIGTSNSSVVNSNANSSSSVGSMHNTTDTSYPENDLWGMQSCLKIGWDLLNSPISNANANANTDTDTDTDTVTDTGTESTSTQSQTERSIGDIDKFSTDVIKQTLLIGNTNTLPITTTNGTTNGTSNDASSTSSGNNSSNTNNNNSSNKSDDLFQKSLIRSGTIGVILSLLRKLTYLHKVLKLNAVAAQTGASTSLPVAISIDNININITNLLLYTTILESIGMEVIHVILSINPIEALQQYHFNGGPSIITSVMQSKANTLFTLQSNDNTNTSASNTTSSANNSGADTSASSSSVTVNSSSNEVEDTVVLTHGLMCLSLKNRLLSSTCAGITALASINSSSSSSSTELLSDMREYLQETVESTNVAFTQLVPYFVWLYNLGATDAVQSMQRSLRHCTDPGNDEESNTTTTTNNNNNRNSNSNNFSSDGNEGESDIKNRTGALMGITSVSSLGALPFPTDVWPWSNHEVRGNGNRNGIYGNLNANIRADVLIPIDLNQRYGGGEAGSSSSSSSSGSGSGSNNDHGELSEDQTLVAQKYAKYICRRGHESFGVLEHVNK
jgi:hypothetical protein